MSTSSATPTCPTGGTLETWKEVPYAINYVSNAADDYNGGAMFPSNLVGQSTNGYKWYRCTQQFSPSDPYYVALLAQATNPYSYAT